MDPQLKSEPTAAFDESLDTITRVISVNLTILMYIVTALQFFRLSFSNYKLAIFASILTVIPICSALILLGKRDQVQNAASLRILASQATIVVAAYLLTGAAIVVWLFGLPITIWTFILRSVVSVLTFIHFGIVLAAPLLSPAGRVRLFSLLSRTMALRGVSSAPLAFLLIVSGAMFIVFRIEPSNPYLNVLFGFAAGFNPKPGWVTLVISCLLAVAAIAGCFRLIRRELERPKDRPFPGRTRLASVAVILAIFYFYFDYKLVSDVLHFLTNVAPAVQIINADSVPMVTAFSQYGPWPMVITWLTFLATSPSFHAANILAQLHSLAFYSIILFCLLRMTRYRAPALLLGVLAIGVVLAGWWGGDGSLNTVPSSMGMRYLPNAFVVLAISLLSDGRMRSKTLFLSVVVSALWSFETLLGSIAILGLFLLVCAVRDRDPVGFLRAAVAVIVFPVAVALSLTGVVTLFWAGKLPDYGTYLNFARVYNMTSEFWALDGAMAFLGWIPVAVAVMTGLTLAWLSAISRHLSVLQCESQIIIYRFAPMAALTGFMSSYYAGRSVDFTLIISFLPLSALVIPVILGVFRESMSGALPRLQLAAFPTLAVFLALTFSFSALYRKGGPYSTAISECLYDRACSPFELAKVTKLRYSLQPMLDRAANPPYFDTSGIAREAINLIELYGANQRQVALFLGVHPSGSWSVHTNAVLVLTNKGHRWPISYVLSDELNPSLQRSIIEADVHLEEGEPVFVRRDESKLGPLESAILARIRSSAHLCPLPTAALMVTAFRVTFQKQCS